MKIRSKRNYYYGQKNGFLFKISVHNLKYYVLCNHTKKDIVFNSLWQSITFESLDDASKWCEEFYYKNFCCSGSDLKNAQ